MKRKVDLCVPCAAKLETAYTVRKIASGVDLKVKCAECGRQRYGGTYELSGKLKSLAGCIL